MEIAKAEQFTENVDFGKPCGLMDQMACSVGGLVHIDFEDPHAPIVNPVSVDFGSYEYSLCIVDTKGSHADLTDDYAKIPLEMKAVAGYFGKDVLREVTKEQFYSNIAGIREKMSDRAVLRAIHFFNEQENVKSAVEALGVGNIQSFLSVIQKSGNTSYKFLQNVYSDHDVTHQNIAVALAVSEDTLQTNGVCRVHGGGFAGTMQAFVKNDYVQEYKRAMDAILGDDACHILKLRKFGGEEVFV